MGIDGSSSAESAHAAFAAKLKWLREHRKVAQMDLEREMKKRGKKVRQKTVSNIEQLVHDSQLGTYAAIAEHFGVPVWVMFIPGLDVALLEGEKLQRLKKLVEDYLRCDDVERKHAENMAAGFADLHRKK
jgi:transcriptional regulator with XRE-family HTH domain